MSEPSLKILFKILGFFAVPKGEFKKRYCILPVLYLVMTAYTMGIHVTNLSTSSLHGGISLFAPLFALVVVERTV